MTDWPGIDVDVVGALPTTGKLGDVVILSTDGRLYRWDVTAGRFVPDGPSVSMTMTLGG